MKSRAYLLLAGLGLAALSCGCHFKGYHVDRSAKALQILGVGWVHEKSGTNNLRVFVVGSLHSGSIRASANTNAPRQISRDPLGIPLTPH